MGLQHRNVIAFKRMHFCCAFNNKILFSLGQKVVRSFGLSLLCFLILFIFLNLCEVLKPTATFIVHDATRKYLINTSSCKILDRHAFSDDVLPFFRTEDDIFCNKQDNLLTFITMKNDIAILHVNESSLADYSIFNLKCCYSKISRLNDYEIKYSECQHFENSIQLSTDDNFIKVDCSSLFSTVYSNVHAIIRPHALPSSSINTDAAFNVIFMGIDSVSKLNLERTMPKTFTYLEQSDFINLRGYTKIEDNTFPNLIAILSGQTYEQISQNYNLSREPLDQCNFIWKNFKEMGYRTAFAEDETFLSTFNYAYKGFTNPPTDFYFRPYFLAAETLPSIKRHFQFYCTGPENTGQRVMNLVKDFIASDKNHPAFGFFWMNSFSHENINAPTAMDNKVYNFLQGIHHHLSEKTIFIFFSDHGFRFGKIRQTYTGWLEERLPFIYVHLPESLKIHRPQEYRNFVENSRQLTSPFDIYMSLQDVLHWSNSSYEIQPSLGCPRCLSLFRQLPRERNCTDAGIADHWCLCSGYRYTSPHSQSALEAASLAIDHVNALVRAFPEGGKCARFHFREIAYAARTETELDDRGQPGFNLRVVIKTRPAAVFEATFKVVANQYHLQGNVSRVNKYRRNTMCLKDAMLKKYCYCDGPFTHLKSAICYFINCV